MKETTELLDFLKGVEGQNVFRQMLVDARKDGVITMEESANLESFIRKLVR